MSLGLNLGQLGNINNVSTLIPQFIGLAGCGANLSNSVVGFNINGLFKQGLAADIPSNLTSFIDGSDVYWKHTSASFYIGKRESDRKWHVLQDASSGQILYSETSASDSFLFWVNVNVISYFKQEMTPKIVIIEKSNWK